MKPIVVRSGNVTVTVSGELEAKLQQVFDTAYRGIRETLDGLGDKLVTDAEAAWYTQVQRRTGETGDLEHVMQLAEDELQVVVKAERTKATYMVQRPGPLSQIVHRASDEEYARAMSQYRRTGQLPKEWTQLGVKFSQGRPTRLKRSTPNPLASDGKNMWQENVRKPGTKQAQDMVQHGSEALAEYMRRNARG